MNDFKCKCKDCLQCQLLTPNIEWWCVDFECNFTKKMVEAWRYCLHYTTEYGEQI